jgi:hypothetical protein
MHLPIQVPGVERAAAHWPSVCSRGRGLQPSARQLMSCTANEISCPTGCSGATCTWCCQSGDSCGSAKNTCIAGSLDTHRTGRRIR